MMDCWVLVGFGPDPYCPQRPSSCRPLARADLCPWRDSISNARGRMLRALTLRVAASRADERAYISICKRTAHHPHADRSL